MEPPSAQAFYELAKAIVAAGDTTGVRDLLQRYEAGEIDFDELVIEIRALSRPLH